MKSMSRYLTLVLLLFISGNGFSQVLTLKEAIAIMLQNNFDILIIQVDQKKAENFATRGNAGFWPTLILNAGYNASTTSIDQRFSNGLEINTNGVNTSNLSGNLGLNWTLFDGGQIQLEYKRLKQLDIIAQSQLRETIQTQVANLIKNYNQIVFLNEQIKAIQTALELAETKLEIADMRLKIGSGDLQEVLQSKVDANGLKATKLQQQIAIKAAKTSLNVLLGRSGELAFEVERNPDMPVIPDLVELLAAQKTKNPLLQRLDESKKLNSLLIKQAKSDWYPQLNAVAAYNFSRNNSNAGFSLFNQSIGPNAGFQLNWNIFSGSQVQTRIRNAQFDFDQSGYQYLSAYIRESSELTRLHQTYTLQKEMVNLSRESMQWAEENLKLATQRLAIGVSDIVTVKEAQRSFSEAVNQWVSAENQYLETATELLRLSGLIFENK